MAAANNDFFEALSMLEHERGITAEYLIEKIKAAIVIAVKKNYEVEDDNVLVEIDPDSGKFNVALVQNVVADEDWYDEHAEIGITEAQKIRKSYEVGDRVVTPLKTKDFGRIAAQTAKHVIRQGIREAERSQQLSEIQSRAHDIIQATVTRVDNEKGIVALDLGHPAPQRAGARRDLHRGPDPAGLRCGRGQRRARCPRDDQPHPPGPGQAPVRAGSARDL